MGSMTKYFKKTSKGDVLLDVIKITFLTFVTVVTLYPFLNIIAISFNDAIDAVRGGIHLWPRQFSLASYQQIFNNRAFMNSIWVTVARTAIGTPISLLVCSAAAFAFSRKELFGRKWLSLLFIFTMYFSGGMIPTYMVIRSLGLLDNFWVFIWPMALNVYNIILIRSYIDSLPDSLIEAARIDGANDIRIYFTIVLPLIKPILLTVGLFVAVAHWNSWFDAFLYTSSQQLKPMQSILVEILNQFQTGGSITQQMSQAAAGRSITPDSIRMAATVVSTLPIIMVYPFISKFIVKGMLIGGVKD
jgi:putative aldouronate transport system permease protein